MASSLCGLAHVARCLLVVGLHACASGSKSDGLRVSGADAVGVLDAGEGGGSDDSEPRDAGAKRDARPAGPGPRDPNDVDGDGARGGVDCNDGDESVYPGASELCDGKDNDCDGFVDTFPVDGRTYHPDYDGDGLGDGSLSVRACETPEGWVLDGSDCDDEDPQRGDEPAGDVCAPNERPVVYVAQHGHDDNAGDAPMRAVRTIQRGITRALSCPFMRCSVLIAEGTYEEAVQLAEGVDLFGGYSADFTVRDSTQHSVVITSQESRTVVAAFLTVPTKLDGLMIQGAFLSGSDGASSYGLSVTGCADHLTLSNVVVRAGRGADGAPGTQGVPQACDARGGQGGTSFDCGASAGGVGDAGGDPASSGGGGEGGKSNCPSACPLVGSDGITTGASGEPGADGEDGAPAQPVSDGLGTFGDGDWHGVQGGDGRRGAHGTGGGGGGAGGTKRIRACFGCGTILGGRGGDGAPGGCGGGGGGGGEPGGAALALALVDSEVSVTDVILLGGAGGKGGAGGDGVLGEPGGRVTGAGHEDASSRKCGAIRYFSGAGGIGGVGGRGGAGAGGAGGIGGAAITVALVGAAALNERGALQIEVGLGGEGGAAGAGPGLAGGLGKPGAQVTEQRF